MWHVLSFLKQMQGRTIGVRLDQGQDGGMPAKRANDGGGFGAMDGMGGMAGER